MKRLILCFLLFALSFCQILELQKYKKTSNVVTSTGKMTIDNYQLYLYYGNFTIGTPSQNTTIVTDIFSSQLWIPLNNDQCYISSQSSTSNITSTSGSIQYGPASVAGYMGTEVIGQASLGLVNLNMITLFVNKQVMMNEVKACGIMGLSNDPSWKNFLEVAVTAGQLSDSQFAFQLKSSNSSVYFYAGSANFPTSITLTWFPVIVSNHWIISITGTIVSGNTYTQPSGLTTGLFDTSTTLVLMANNAYNALLNDSTISAQCQQQQGYVLCPCLYSGYPTVYFQSNNHSLAVQPADYMDPLSGSYCMLGFVGIDATTIPFLVLGDVFIRNYFFALDKTNNQVGLGGSGVHALEY